MEFEKILRERLIDYLEPTNSADNEFVEETYVAPILTAHRTEVERERREFRNSLTQQLLARGWRSDTILQLFAQFEDESERG